MKKLLFFVFAFLTMFSFISGLCEEGQININSASLAELDELTGIGPVKSQAIIDTQPFSSVEDLTNVYGIGPVTLGKIKEQGLACVEGEVEEVENLGEVVEEQGVVVRKKTEQGEKQEEEFEMITLTTQTIKSPENKGSKSNYALYGFVGFCVLLGILFVIKRKKYKNEFR